MEARIHLPTPPGPDRATFIAELLETLTEANAVWFGEHPDAPCCPACAGVRYRLPPRGLACQNFWAAPDVLQRGVAGCADAACYEAGYARAQGKHAIVVLEPQDESGIEYHAVAYVNGERIDVAAELDGYPNKATSRCELEDAGVSVGGCGGCPSCGGCPYCGGRGCPRCLPVAVGAALEPGEDRPTFAGALSVAGPGALAAVQLLRTSAPVLAQQAALRAMYPPVTRPIGRVALRRLAALRTGRRSPSPQAAQAIARAQRW